MDQIRAFLGWIKRQHFWLLSAIIMLTGAYLWYSSSTRLSEEYKSAKSTITGEFEKIGRIGGQGFHPNEVVNAEQQEQIKVQAEQVQQLWQQLYAAQQQAVLKWPEDLGDDFKKHISRLKFGDDIHPRMLGRYQNYAKKHFPELPKIVQSPELASEGNSRGGGRGGSSTDIARIQDMMVEGNFGRRRGEDPDEDDDTPKENYLVYWADQGKVREKLIFPQQPSSKRVWVTQEDLWVYTTLLQAIANTNEAAGATRFDNAPIKVIETLDVGKEAATSTRATGRILVRQKAAAGGGGGEYGDYGGYGGEGGEYGGEGGGYGGYGGEGGEYGGYGGEYGEGGGGGGGSAKDAALVSQRYLDAEGKPITITDEWAASDFGTEYKQLPVKMRLTMDQRWLYHLISECGNAPLQIEVQEVRINPADGGGSRRGGSRSQRLYSLESKGRSGSSALGGRGSANILAFDRKPNIVPVEIQGTIYIFNEPDMELLAANDSGDDF